MNIDNFETKYNNFDSLDIIFYFIFTFWNNFEIKNEYPHIL